MEEKEDDPGESRASSEIERISRERREREREREREGAHVYNREA